MRNMFKDSALQHLFDGQGYIVVPSLLKGETIKKLTDIYNEAYPGDLDPGLHCTLYYDSHAQKKWVNDQVNKILIPIVNNWLEDYTPILVDYPVKGHLTEGDVAMHQDWAFVDEKKHTSLNVWIPLVDVNDENGAYFVLGGSNKIAQTVHGSHIPLPCDVVKYKVQYQNMQYLPMNAGDAIIYDHRLMHRTPPNNSDKKRIALSLNLIPAEAKAIHYYKHADSGKIELLEIEHDFFTKYTYNPAIQNNKIPEGVKSLGFIDDYKYVCFNESQVMPLYRNKSFLQKLKVGMNSFQGKKQS
jgi:hypothetical protein